MIPHSKVFVGGLPSGSKPHELRRLFENYGVVTECDIMNRCGFVHMETPQMADTAIRALNNTTFKGAMITVEPGRPKNRSVGDGGGMRRSGGGPGSSRGNYSGIGELSDRGGIGPMRRERGFGQRRGMESPYGRGGGGNFQDSFQSGNRSRNFDGNGGASGSYNYGPPNTYGGNNNGGMGNYASSGSSGNYGMGNQDKRGFALPDHSYQSRAGPMMASPEHATGINHAGRAGIRAGSNPNPFSRAMQAHGEEVAADGGFGRPNSFGHRPLGRGSMGLNQPERQFSAPSRDDIRFGQGNSRPSGGGHADGRFSMNQNYEDAFPPLNVSAGQRGFRGRGGGGRGFGRGGAPPNRYYWEVDRVDLMGRTSRLVWIRNRFSKRAHCGAYANRRGRPNDSGRKSITNPNKDTQN